ncbi:MAG: oligosaccharide flippase family protein [Phycisphaerae bacterium]|nr:oligosaccharide flippase family protein [Phycisphaerae bacterium]
MSFIARLLQVGSVAQSMSVYLPAIFVQRALGLGRLILLTYLLPKAEMGNWALGVMIFTMGAPLVTLGVNNSLVRYVSLYELRGELGNFFRKICIGSIILVVVLTGAAFFASGNVIQWAGLLKSMLAGGTADIATNGAIKPLAVVIFANVGAMALYLNLLSFIYGLRAYRLASLVEVLFSALFTIGVLFWVSMEQTAMALLLAHLFSMGLTLIVGWLLLRIAVQRFSSPELREELAPALSGPVSIEPTSDGDSGASGLPLRPARRIDEGDPVWRGGWARMVRFGVVTMIGTLIWQGAGFVSLLMIYLRYGSGKAGPFFMFIQLAQPIIFLANAVWGVLFAHVARYWENGDRRQAMFVLETAFKAVALVVMTFSVILYVASPTWVKILGQQYRYGHFYLSGLLTFFVTMSNFALLTILAKLHEKPAVISLAAFAGAGLNAILAILWMPDWGEIGAARAAGVGMFFGGGLVVLVYLLASQVRMHDSTYFILGMPILLLLPPGVLGPLWVMILPLCLLSRWCFDAKQSTALKHSLKRGWVSFRQGLRF